MIETNRRTNVVDVQVIPEGRSEPETHRHPAEEFGYDDSAGGHAEQAVIDAVMEEYEGRQRAEVLAIWYTVDESAPDSGSWARVLYESPRY
jgi:hypothetical protein